MSEAILTATVDQMELMCAEIQDALGELWDVSLEHRPEATATKYVIKCEKARGMNFLIQDYNLWRTHKFAAKYDLIYTVSRIGTEPITIEIF